jgi:hypothetical protein
VRYNLIVVFSLLLCCSAKAQGNLPPPPQPAPAQLPPADVPPRPPAAQSGQTSSPRPCASSELDKLMTETKRILARQISSDGLTRYLQDENKAYGPEASWTKVHARMQDILNNEQNAKAIK